MPRPRKEIDPKSKEYGDRFALRLRDLLDRRKLNAAEFLDRVRAAGVDVSAEAIRKWIAGDHLPRPQDMPAIGTVLGLRDYRDLLPPPE